MSGYSPCIRICCGKGHRPLAALISHLHQWRGNFYFLRCLIFNYVISKGALLQMLDKSTYDFLGLKAESSTPPSHGSGERHRRQQDLSDADKKKIQNMQRPAEMPSDET